MHPYQPTRSLTLMEALTLAFLALLVLMLLASAVLKVREVANVTRCSDNLRNVGLASHNEYSDHAGFGSGVHGPARFHGNNTTFAKERGPWFGYLALALPYVDDGFRTPNGWYTHLWLPPQTFPSGVRLAPARFSAIDRCTEHEPWWTVTGNLVASSGQFQPEHYLCPSAPRSLPNDQPMASYYVANGTFQRLPLPLAGMPMGRTHYLGVAGAAGDFDDPQANQAWSQFTGVLYNRSRHTFGDIEGTSTTLLFGESIGGLGADGRRDYATWMGCGALGTAYGLGRGNGTAPSEPPPLGITPEVNQDGAAWYRFSSFHPRGVQFCMADGSVRLIPFGKTTQPSLDNGGRNDTDWSLLQQLAGRRKAPRLPLED